MSELVARLDGIFKGLFGVQLEYIAADQIQSADWDLAGLSAYLRNEIATPPFIRDITAKRIGLPIRCHGNFAGLAILVGGDTIDIQRVLELADLATAMLERELETNSNSTVESLRQTEEHMELQRGHENVIPLRPARKQVTTIRDDFEILQESDEVYPLRSMLISSSSGFPFQRVAFAIHAQAARWAFVSINDLPADAFDSIEAFQKLGAITVFIEDLACISPERQQKLVEFLHQEPSVESPLVIAAVTEEPDQLVAAGLLADGLRAKLVLLRLPWNPQDTDSATVRKTLRIVNEGRTLHAETRFVPFHADFLDPDQPTVH